MASGIFPPPVWAGGHEERPPNVEIERGRDPIWFPAPIFEVPFYGRHLGPGFSDQPPITPVDRVAYYHDREYGAIQEHYGLSDTAWVAWLQPFIWLHEPRVQWDLAMADLRTLEDTWSGIGEGIESGFYSGEQGLQHLAGDLFWGSLMTGFHLGLAWVRLGFYTIYSHFNLYSGLITGDVSLGDFLVGHLKLGAELVSAAFYTAVGLARGVWRFGISIPASLFKSLIPGLSGDAARRLGGAAAGAGIGFAIGGPIGGVVGGIVGAVGGGCFLTAACVEAAGLDDDCHELRVLRRFRDEVLAKSCEGRKDVAHYYEVAPEIVAAIRARPDARELLLEIRESVVLPCVEAIESGAFDQAHRLYRRAARRLSNRFLDRPCRRFERLPMGTELLRLERGSASAPRAAVRPGQPPNIERSTDATASPA